MEILPFIAIVLSIVAIGVSIYTLVTFNKKRLGRRAVKDIVEEEISRSDELQSLRRAIKSGNDTKHDVTLAEDEFNALVATVLSEMQKKDIVAKIDEVEFPEPPAQETVKSYLFASSFDKEKGTFFTVEKDIFPKAIFKICIDPQNENRATFTVLESAYEKAAEVKDFLEGCTKIYGIGNELTVKKEGVLTKHEGIWTVEEPIEIQFV